jgi:hypothetical protein
VRGTRSPQHHRRSPENGVGFDAQQHFLATLYFCALGSVGFLGFGTWVDVVPSTGLARTTVALNPHDIRSAGAVWRTSTSDPEVYRANGMVEMAAARDLGTPQTLASTSGLADGLWSSDLSQDSVKGR